MLGWVLTLFTFSVLTLGALCGLAGFFIAGTDDDSRRRGFQWGAAFGPFGLMVVVGRRSRQLVSASRQPGSIPAKANDASISAAKEGAWYSAEQSPATASSPADGQHQTQLTATGQRSTSQPNAWLIYIGALACFVSGLLPWWNEAGGSGEVLRRPITDGMTKPTVVIVWMVLAIGIGWFLYRGSVSIVGCAAAIWFNISVLVYMTSGTASWIPIGISDRFKPVQLDIGVALGIIGAACVLIGCALLLTGKNIRHFSTWQRIGFAIGIALSFALFAVRNAIWVQATIGGTEWNAGPEAFWILGTVIVIATALGAVLALVRGLWNDWRVEMLMVLVGTAISLACGVAHFATSKLDRAAEWITQQGANITDSQYIEYSEQLGVGEYADRLEGIADSELSVLVGPGPLLGVILGLILIGNGLLPLAWRIRQIVHRRSNGETSPNATSNHVAASTKDSNSLTKPSSPNQSETIPWDL